MTTKEILDSLRTDFVSSVDLYFKPVTAVAREFRNAIFTDVNASSSGEGPKTTRRSAPPPLKITRA
jgi:hypothetical protein